MMESRADAGRSLSIIVSILIFAYHAATAYLCTYLPSDPLYVSVSVTGYAWYGCALSLLGVLGSIKRLPILLTIFSNHLLIDTVLSLVPKIGLLYIFHDLTADLCIGSMSSSFWLPTDSQSLHGPGRVLVNGVDQMREFNKARRNCELGFSMARVALLAVLIFWTTAQWGLGLYIRRYAVKLEINGRAAQGGDSLRDLEKAFYEEDSLADEYRDAVRAVSTWTRSGTEKQPVIENDITIRGEKEEALR